MTQNLETTYDARGSVAQTKGDVTIFCRRGYGATTGDPKLYSAYRGQEFIGYFPTQIEASQAAR